jgi:Tol biopolymer transport system component
LAVAGLLSAALACSFFAAPTPPSDLLATLVALTPLGASPSAPDASPSLSAGSGSVPIFATPTFDPSGGPVGKIVFTCQIFKVQASNQICIMNADGSGYRRLTTEDGRQHYYPSPSPDGTSVVYAAFREANVYEIYELTLADGSVRQLTDRLGIENSPEISPDGSLIVFKHEPAGTEKFELWVMNRDGSDPHRIFNGTGWDPTWSPDGTQILFASNMSGINQLHIVNADGSGVRQVSNLPALRGRSDWSPQNQIVTYSGGSWAREVFLMNMDGSDQHQISPPGGNSQGPSFSPDGQWVAFTAYFDRFNDIHGCEIYIMRRDGSDLRRLTNNEYCDYQPRWGP